jgi:amidophosphoribosyltransferase
MNENCGICGCSKTNSQETIYKMLLQLQHRGQLSAGITAFQPKNHLLLRTYKNLGLVNDVFKTGDKNKFNSIMERFSTNKAIGHVRYSTCGVDDKTYAQPFEHIHGKKNRWFSISFNGNIANYVELKNDLEKNNYHLIRKTDTEVLLLLLAKSLKSGETITDAFSDLSKKLDGSYNLALINAEGALVAARDPLGMKPLCYAEKDGEFAFASESVALQVAGFHKVKDLEQGKILIHKKGELRIEEFAKSEKKAHCFFEWVYFAHAASKIEDKIVYEVRNKLGKELAKLETENLADDCVVIPVPDSSTPAGNGFAEALRLPLREGLIRNRYIGRTFIESKDRADRVKSKFTLIKEIFKNKKVFLIEDSIVRGTTLKTLVAFIKKHGEPKEIHVRVSSPPIMCPCFYGIDMSTRKELIASDKTEAEIAKELGVNSVKYQSINGLVNALGLPKKDICLACINGEYPTQTGEKRKNE